MRPVRPFTVALPKKGRLRDSFNRLFETAGYHIEKQAARHDFATIYSREQTPEDPPFEAVLQKAEDALLNIQDNLVDAAIVGRDKYEEIQARFKLENETFRGRMAAHFNFSACRMAIAAPPGQDYRSPLDLKGLKIATSYPATLKTWLQESGLQNNEINIITRNGGIEDYVRLGAADAICDIVDSGRSLKENALVPYFTLYKSQAVLVVSDQALYNKEKEFLQARLLATNNAIVSPSGATNHNHLNTPQEQRVYSDIISNKCNL